MSEVMNGWSRERGYYTALLDYRTFFVGRRAERGSGGVLDEVRQPITMAVYPTLDAGPFDRFTTERRDLTKVAIETDNPEYAVFSRKLGDLLLDETTGPAMIDTWTSSNVAPSFVSTVRPRRRARSRWTGALST